MENGYIPALALITAAFEIAMGLAALRARGPTRVLRPTAAILFVLAGYQLLEVFACAPGASSWPARLAFIDIVWLPPLGVWLVLQLSAADSHWPRKFGASLFIAAGGISMWVLLDPGFVTRTVCSAVLARYYNGPYYSIYGAFYLFGLLMMILSAAWGMTRTDDHAARRHIAYIQVGTLGFVLPAMMTELFVPGIAGQMPSLMCHYALSLGIFLALVVRETHNAAAEQVTSSSGTREQSLNT